MRAEGRGRLGHYAFIYREGQELPIKFNNVDDKTNRVSHMGEYKIINGLPRYEK